MLLSRQHAMAGEQGWFISLLSLTGIYLPEGIITMSIVALDVVVGE